MLAPRWAAGRGPTVLARGLGLVLAVIGLVAILAVVSGHDPRRAITALWNGAFGSTYAVLSSTLVRATPLILTGCAVALAFTAGVMNIGAEGQLLAGATAATGFAFLIPDVGAWLAVPMVLAAGAAAGSAWALIPAWLRRRFGVLEVISTIMMNFVALYLVGYLVRGPLQEPTEIYPQSAAIPAASRLPFLVPGTRLHLGFAIALVAAALLWWALRFTAAGFRIRVLGANANAARSASRIDVGRTAMRAFLLSGALAGTAGAIEVMGVTFSLYENLSPGYGYTAIAVALVAGLDPALTAMSALLFGALEAGAAAMQRDAGVPSVLATVVEASIVLFVLAWTVSGRRFPRVGSRAGVTSTLPEARSGTG